jgi:uncharacterized short protein YbdD (DUF466 family)
MTDGTAGRVAATAGQVAATPGRVRLVCERVAQTARLMVGVPDYQTYVTHRQTQHPDQPFMTYQEFFRERQDARYAIGKGRFRGCC